MSDSIKQSLSALMDDEVGEFELRKTLKQLDPSAADVWSRYHLLQAVLKRDAPVQPQLDISARVMAELEQEPSYQQPLTLADRSKWWSFGGVAVAASVTLMVIFGAQSYQAESPAIVGSSQVALSAPAPINPNLLSVQYGKRAVVPPSLQQSDVIRLSSSMEYYIEQHHALTDNRPMQWSVEWMPEGFRVIEHDRVSDSEILLYSNGEASVSVSVQPFVTKKANPGAVQSGETVAVGKQVHDQFVTVVGDVPFMIADRIASSIVLRNN